MSRLLQSNGKLAAFKHIVAPEFDFHSCANREHPPTISSGPGLRQWMCVVHNEVNKSLNKPNFNCNIVDARWGALDCGDELACDLTARPGR